MPKRILRWASYYVGYRGVMAVVLGILWTLIGVSTVLNLSGTQLPIPSIPLWLRGLFWLVPGVYAIAWTLARAKTSRAQDHNVWGLLMVGPASRFVLFVAAGIMDAFGWGHRPGGTWVGILGWLAVVIMVGTCAVGLDRLPPVRPEEVGKHG